MAYSGIHWPSVLIAAGSVAACPTIWSIVARNEYKNKTMTKFFGSKYRGCYALAAWIFCSSLYRDKLFERAVAENAAHKLIDGAAKGGNGAALVRAAKCAGWALISAGATLVGSSLYQLGITGTYLGDYFGILMSERVTAFPFSTFEDPMYLGSSLCFAGYALRENSAVGLALSAWVYAVYYVSCHYFENPFTDSIYEQAAWAKSPNAKSPLDSPKKFPGSS